MPTIIANGENILIVTIEQFKDGHYLVVTSGLSGDTPSKKKIVHSIEDVGKVIHREMLDTFFKPIKESLN